jgi:hypothetical protein
MRYLLLIGRDDKSPPPPSPDDGMTIVQAHIRVSKELTDAGKRRGLSQVLAQYQVDSWSTSRTG